MYVFVVFNQGFCVFIQYKLGVGISHLSISGQWSMVGVMFPTVFTLYYFLLFNCLLVDICLLFLFPCFSDSFLSSQESTLTCLFFLSLVRKMWGKGQQFHSFFPLDIYENTFVLRFTFYLYYWFLTFLAVFCFSLYIGNFQTTIL